MCTATPDANNVHEGRCLLPCLIQNSIHVYSNTRREQRPRRQVSAAMPYTKFYTCVQQHQTRTTSTKAGVCCHALYKILYMCTATPDANNVHEGRCLLPCLIQNSIHVYSNTRREQRPRRQVSAAMPLYGFIRWQFRVTLQM